MIPVGPSRSLSGSCLGEESMVKQRSPGPERGLRRKTVNSREAKEDQQRKECFLEGFLNSTSSVCLLTDVC